MGVRMTKEVMWSQLEINSLRAGIDLLCIGNNLAYEESAAREAARAIGRAAHESDLLDPLTAAVARIRTRKRNATPPA